MILLFSGMDDMGENHEIEIDRPYPDWYSSWARMSNDCAMYQSLTEYDKDVVRDANLCVILLFNQMLLSPDLFDAFHRLLEAIQCPIIFEWENILFHTPYLGEPLQRLSEILDSLTGKVLYDYYLDPDTVGLRDDFMRGCTPLTLNGTYFDTEFIKSTFNPCVKKDGSIFVIYDGRDEGRNGYWTHKYANSLASEVGCKYNTHKGYGNHGFDYKFFENRNFLCQSAGLPWEQYAYHIEHASLVVNMDERPWQGRLAMDVAAAKTPYLCVRHPVLHHLLWGDFALDNWHNYAAVMTHGLKMYNNCEAPEVAFGMLDDIDYRHAKPILRDKLGIEF